MNKIVRWIGFIPAAAFSAFLAGGLVLGLGNYFLGRWKIPSGLVIFFGAQVIAFSWMIMGLNVAPAKTRAVKWILLIPLLLFSIVCAANLILLRLKLVTLPSEMNTLSHSLSPNWQIIIFNLTFIFATLVIASKSPTEIAD
jgi:hypothetical protein